MKWSKEAVERYVENRGGDAFTLVDSSFPFTKKERKIIAEWENNDDMSDSDLCDNIYNLALSRFDDKSDTLELYSFNFDACVNIDSFEKFNVAHLISTITSVKRINENSIMHNDEYTFMLIDNEEVIEEDVLMNTNFGVDGLQYGDYIFYNSYNTHYLAYRIGGEYEFCEEFEPYGFGAMVIATKKGLLDYLDEFGSDIFENLSEDELTKVKELCEVYMNNNPLN